MLCHVRKPQLTEMGKAMPIQFMTRQIYKTKFGVFVPPQERKPRGNTGQFEPLPKSVLHCIYIRGQPGHYLHFDIFKIYPVSVAVNMRGRSEDCEVNKAHLLGF